MSLHTSITTSYEAPALHGASGAEVGYFSIFTRMGVTANAIALDCAT
ncbi:MAG: hypothetical protein ACRC62_38820 [Microcoleus sp.]